MDSSKRRLLRRVSEQAAVPRSPTAPTTSGRARFAQPAFVNVAAGAVWAPRGRPRVVFGSTIMRGKIVEIDILADPERLRQLDLSLLND